MEEREANMGKGSRFNSCQKYPNQKRPNLDKLARLTVNWICETSAATL